MKKSKKSLDDPSFEAVRRALLSTFDTYQKNNKRITPDQLNKIQTLSDGHQLVDMIAQLLMIAPNRKQTLLEGTNAVKRMETLLTLLEQELDIQQN